jgi:hypothetical protein
MRSPWYLCVSVPNVTRQRLGNIVPVARNTHETTEELLDAVFSMRSVSYQILCMGPSERKVLLCLVFPELLIHILFTV